MDIQQVFLKLLLILFISIASCSKEEVEINVPKRKQELVLYSTIVPLNRYYGNNKTLGIELTTTRYISDTSKIFINDALIMYFENGNLLDTLFYNDTCNCYPIKYSYQYPREGNRYSLEVYLNGDTITTKTYIPSIVEIKDTSLVTASYLDGNTIYSDVSLTFEDPPGEDNFYEICISDMHKIYEDPSEAYNLTTADNVITSESYYPSLMSFNVDKPKYLLFSDKSIKGKQYTINISYQPPVSLVNDTFLIHSHFATIRLRSVTEDYYKFKTSMLMQHYSKKEDMLYGIGEPLNVFSNINGGMGLFAGFNNHVVAFYIPEQKVKEKTK